MEQRIFFVMGANFDNRFDLEDLQKTITSLDNGSFKKLVFQYQPSLGQFTYHPEFGEAGYTRQYNDFVNAVQNSKYKEYFMY